MNQTMKTLVCLVLSLALALLAMAITIFNPETVRDNADFTKGKHSLPSTGIPYVIVNWTVVVKDSKELKDVYPGQPIRNAVHG